MLFDFDEFKRVAERVFPEECGYTLEEALTVFQYFFQKYEEFTGKPHPPIKENQIVRIALAMPYFDLQRKGEPAVDVFPEYYPDIINQYFQTPFQNCNYRINHFFSGRIRELRYCELLC